MKQNLKKGFTLIELLVVIAIIGILSAVVMASLNTARSRAANASVQSNLETVRLQTEIYYDDNNQSYGEDTTDCVEADTIFADSVISSAIEEAVSKGDNNSGATCTIDDNGQSWAVSVPFRRSADGSWCVDWTGYAGQGTADEGRCDN